jgi:hypothetical protein
MRYTMDFSLYCFDIVSKAILGTAAYTVNMAKQNRRPQPGRRVQEPQDEDHLSGNDWLSQGQLVLVRCLP